MKSFIPSCFRAAFLAAFFLPVTLFAQQPKVGCVDMSKIFPEYHKTKKAEAEMGDALSAVQKEVQARQTELNKMNDDFKKLKEDAANPAFTEQKRAEKRKAMDDKEVELRLCEQKARQWSQERGRELLEKRNQTMQTLVDDIVKIIQEKAKKEGYTMIVDKSSVSPKGNPPVPVPSFLFLQDSIDLTVDILKTLNANAPAAVDKPKDKK